MEVIARLAADESLGDRVMKVDHAGEHGAVNIYRAQLLACRWRRSDITSELRDFLDHEMRHRAVFAAELMRAVDLVVAVIICAGLVVLRLVLSPGSAGAHPLQRRLSRSRLLSYDISRLRYRHCVR